MTPNKTKENKWASILASTIQWERELLATDSADQVEVICTTGQVF